MKKNNETFNQKSFSVFNELPSKHTKTFYFLQNILLIVSTLMKNLFCIISRSFNKIMLVLTKRVIFYSKTFTYLRCKKVLLENPKTKFLDITKTQKSKVNIKIVLQKTFLSDLESQLLILLVS